MGVIRPSLKPMTDSAAVVHPTPPPGEMNNSTGVNRQSAKLRICRGRRTALAVLTTVD